MDYLIFSINVLVDWFIFRYALHLYKCICIWILVFMFIFNLIVSPQRPGICDRWALETECLWIWTAFFHRDWGPADLPLGGNACSWVRLHRQLTAAISRLAIKMGQDSPFETRSKCRGTVHIHTVKILSSPEQAHLIHTARWSMPSPVVPGQRLRKHQMAPASAMPESACTIKQ